MIGDAGEADREAAKAPLAQRHKSHARDVHF